MEDQIKQMEQQIQDLQNENERLRQERIAHMNSKNVVTCAFCGEQYPPGTPRSNHQSLTDHVKKCPDHPLGKKIRKYETLLTTIQRELEEDWSADLNPRIVSILQMIKDGIKD